MLWSQSQLDGSIPCCFFNLYFLQSKTFPFGSFFSSTQDQCKMKTPIIPVTSLGLNRLLWCLDEEKEKVRCWIEANKQSNNKNFEQCLDAVGGGCSWLEVLLQAQALTWYPPPCFTNHRWTRYRQTNSLYPPDTLPKVILEESDKLRKSESLCPLTDQLSSPIFTCSGCPPVSMVKSPFISTVWCSRPYKPFF